MNDMSSVYWRMSTQELRTLRSKKYNRRLKLQATRGLSYLGLQELRTLNYQIDLIDRNIDARNAQMWLIP
jgi:hypothetical protein